MNDKIQEEFKELIKDIIQDEIASYLKNNNYYQLVTGKIVEIKNNRYSLDIGDTFITDVVNKSNINLKLGDTVTMMVKADSNYSNCFILCKNGDNNYNGEKQDSIMASSITNLNNKVAELQKSLNTSNEQIKELEARGYYDGTDSNGRVVLIKNGVSKSGYLD